MAKKKQKKQPEPGSRKCHDTVHLSICPSAADPQSGPRTSLSARFLDSPENRQKVLASVPLDLLSFLGTGPQTTNDDVADLPK